MKKLIVLTLIITMAVFMLFSAGGCFNVGQKVAERVTEEAIEKSIEEEIESEGGEADVDISEDAVSVTTDEGEMTIGEGAELPEGFPEEVPVYSNMEITSSWKVTEEGKDTFSISGTTSDSGKTVFDWYKGKLNSWEIENEFTGESEGESTYSISANNGTYGLLVWITESDGETIVGITAAKL